MGHSRENDTPDAHEARKGELGRAYATALLAGDEIAAEISIRDAMDAKLSTAEIDDEIIAPALWLVGRLWERGDISVADEHLATSISLRVLALQREVARTVRGREGAKALLAAPEGEMHFVALQMISVLLRDAGYTVLMLGPDVPLGALAESAGRHEPQVVCMTATMPDASDRLTLAIHEVEQTLGGAGYVIGGRGISPRLRPRPRIQVCERVSQVVEAADALVKRADLN
jgi:MerR family transcriptional regulator, light-induced transcriptional regulator